MKTYTIDELQDNLDSILLTAASGKGAAKIKVTDQLNAIIIDESEWSLLCDVFNRMTESQKAVAHG